MATVGPTIAGALTSVVAVLPLFLAGALVVQIGGDFTFTASRLGVSVAVFWVANGLASVHLGRLTDRIGGSASVRLTGAASMVVLVGLPATTRTWPVLLAWMVIAGLTHGLGQPAANRLLSDRVPRHRQGIAFGVKQAGVPLGSVIAGASVPLIAAQLSWRWAYLVAAVSAVVLLGMVRPRRGAGRSTVTRRGGPREPLRDRGLITLLAFVFAFGAGAGNAVPMFYVDAAVRAGSSPAFSGTMLAVASASAVAMRLVLGVVSDRMVSGHLRLCAVLLFGGTFGFGLLATGRTDLMAVGVVVTLVGAWGFNGVFWFALMRAFPEAPGAVTGAVQPGGSIGNIVAPLVLGTLADSLGYTATWLFGGSLGLAAALGMLVGARRLRADDRAGVRH